MKIKIKDVQAIKSAQFEIKGFTAIVGKSNIGKSSVMRALRYMFKNKGGLTREGAKYSEVTLKDDDLDILWQRGNQKNYYKINDVEFDKINRDIPPPILNAGIQEISVGSSKVDVQTNHQFSPLFLIDRTGKEAAEIISSVNKLNVISKAGKTVARDIKNNQNQKKFYETEIKTLEKEMNQLDDLDSCEKTINNLESKLLTHNKKWSKNESLKEQNEKLKIVVTEFEILIVIRNQTLTPQRNSTQHLRWLKNNSKRIHDLEKITKLLSSLPKKLKDPKNKSLNQLSLLKSTKVKEREKTILNKLVSEVRNLGSPDLTDRQNKLRKLKKYKELQDTLKLSKDLTLKPRVAVDRIEDLRRIQRLYRSKLDIESKISQTEQALNKLSDSKQKLIKKMGVCPVCGNKTNA